MADDPTQAAPAGAATPTPSYQQLTQARVPLDDAGKAFAVPDESGRLPIVVLPDQPFRIRNGFVVGGAIAVAVGLVLDLDLAARSAALAVGAVLVFLGVFQSFLVAVPEGAQALLLKSGRYSRTIGAGRHVVPPWIVVSHLVTVREIPFDAPAVQVPTQDDVRVDLDLLLTFRISAPERFVFAISAPDFDQVCQAACLEATRNLVRSKRSTDILDLTADDASLVQAAVGGVLAPYGVEIVRVVVTHVQPPLEFMASREARRLASVRRDEQTDLHALEERLLADREALERQRVAAQRERIELEAANEELRLQRLEARLAAYPNAARRDLDDGRLRVAEALASNTRAMVQVGQRTDVADALMSHTLIDAHDVLTAQATPTPGRSPADGAGGDATAGPARDGAPDAAPSAATGT